MKGDAPHVDILHALVGNNYAGLHAPALSLALDGLHSAANDLRVVAWALAAEDGVNGTFVSAVSNIAERLSTLAVICHDEDEDKVPGDNGPGFDKGGAS